jgi:hypothetical protein
MKTKAGLFTGTAEREVMTQATAAGVLGAIGLITAAAAATVIWLVVHEPIKVADAIARWL